MNLQAALNVLHDSGPLTSPQIGRALDVYPSTVKRLLETLEAAGLAESSAHSGDAQVGRPPRLWALRGEAGYAVGIHVEPKTLRAVVVDLRGRVCRRHTLHPTPPATTVTLLGRIREVVQRVLAGIRRDSVLGLGVGVTGVVDPASGVLTRSAGLRDGLGLSTVDYPLRQALETAIPWPVLVGNDANVGALAVFRRLAREGQVAADGSLFYLLLSEYGAGIGSGLIIRGEPFSGAHGATGEVMAPGRALHEPELRDLWADAVAGDVAARHTVLKLRRPMIAHAVSLCEALDPDCVVLGGQFGALQPEASQLVHRLLDATPDYWGYLEEAPACGLVGDPLWPDTIAVGAADLVLERLFRRPAPGETGPLVTKVLQPAGSG
jgi:predicted NBD/HSP70 family sugar kinase